MTTKENHGRNSVQQREAEGLILVDNIEEIKKEKMDEEIKNIKVKVATEQDKMQLDMIKWLM